MVEISEALLRVAAARVAILGTVTPDGRPHLVPITFALLPANLEGDPGSLRPEASKPVIVSAVDDKPKRSRRLQRLANLAAHAQASVLVHNYEDDWSRLWWVRLEGGAEVLEQDEAGVAALAAKYAYYLKRPPFGPFVRITVESIRGWSSAP